MCCRQPLQILLVLSIYATCFGRTDHSQVFKHMTLNPKIKFIYLFSISEISQIVQVIIAYVASHYKHFTQFSCVVLAIQQNNRQRRTTNEKYIKSLYFSAT